ncbi:3-carboxy-cis,cis-muconate cycloisomerase [Actinocorallia sp. API 0066]|uniref:3-carboxy-cis,cis-muconate cycloisomerase n=1 Tax=Actinocorallia sp. API 0066 TaxID=2896846 RepID=UPI001E396028|nr:3-carboxy-cis,cis-muconate cycloisomerase [Actinocorallia sp. API 0066]MCD0448919.1 3-carboxy-cis,cis-muconate cycloisomerase [Actinocorallia sp. API 0066]
MFGLLTPGVVGTAVEAATEDAAVLRAMLAVEAALTRAQAGLGLVPRAAADALDALDVSGFDLRELALRARAGGNPVIPFVADLKAAVGPEVAPYVHRGATSQDILDTALMLVARDAVALILADLDQAAARLKALAAAHRATPMAGRTLTQHAVPTTFGLKAAGWRHLVLDARDRLAAVRRTLPAQLGGAAGTLAAFTAFTPEPADSDRLSGMPEKTADGAAPAAGADGSRAGLDGLVAAFARETGLARPLVPWHVLRTPVADLGGALGFVGGALGKVAADVLVLGRTEVGEVAEGDGGGSSAMPHKSNPVRATLVAAAARRLPGLAAVLLGALVAEDERPAGAWHAEWEALREALRLAGGAAHAAERLVAGLAVHPDRMRANLALTHGLVVAERAAAALAASLGRERARTLLQEASAHAVQGGAPLAEAVAALLPPGTPLPFDPDPTTYLGAAPALTDAALTREAAP